MNEKVEQLTSEVSKRDRAILSLENQKDGYLNQINNKEKSLEELRSDNVNA